MSLLRVYARSFLINKTVTALELVKNSNFHASDSPPKPTLLNRDSCSEEIQILSLNALKVLDYQLNSLI